MTHPIHITDQLAAAAADAERNVRDAMSDHPGAIIHHTPGPPDWVMDFITHHNQLVEQPHPQCIHLGKAPAVCHVAVWAPGFVCCTSCADAGLLATRVPPGEDQRCDVCGTDTDGGPLWGGLLRGGHIVIHFAVCASCDPATVTGQ
jgi:hypothetical protein